MTATILTLPLSSVYCSQQADLTLQEAVRIAQESSDHVCLQHCLVRRPHVLLMC